MLNKPALFLIAFLLAPSSAWAQTACPEHYADGQPPQFLDEGWMQGMVELCKTEFAVLHSSSAAVPMWSAQNLTAEEVRAAKAVERVDRFHPDPALPPEDRAELAHYRGSGMDRGHLAPSADMATPQGQEESFSLANIIPQEPSLNRRLWAHIEATARGLALGYGQVSIVTGAAFVEEDVRQVGGRVLVPDAVYKAIWVPSAGAGAAWWADNLAPGDQYETISLEELTRRTGIDHFPTAPDDAKRAGAVLPEPSPKADSAAWTN